MYSILVSAVWMCNFHSKKHELKKTCCCFYYFAVTSDVSINMKLAYF